MKSYMRLLSHALKLLIFPHLFFCYGSSLCWDYIHRVGRTARAGRSGVAISLVNQYELEWYLQIENLIGKKLPEFPAQEEEILMLLDRVNDAKRISHTKLKEGGGGKKRRGGDDDDKDDVEKYIGFKHKKSKMLKKGDKQSFK
ncbi:hypothetical protein OIU78_028566 [Salix suchowensis]|nr:hypothetical protein OIU78_028566 [Salix suchowensis]